MNAFGEFQSNEAGLVKEWNTKFQFVEIAWVEAPRSKLKTHIKTLLDFK